MGKKTKVVMITKDFDLNGISNVVSNYCDHLPADQYDIMILAGSPVVTKYVRKYSKGNIKLVQCPSKTTSPAKYYMAIYKYLKQHSPDIVHIHGSSAVIAVELLIAWICGIKVRIAHSHNISCTHTTLHKLLSPICNWRGLATWRFACSRKAGEWVFKNAPFTVLPNAFDTKKYVYDAQQRQRIRQELGIENKIVLGHVGLFTYQKNQSFLLKIFESIAEKNKDMVLLFVGAGLDFEMVQDAVPNHLKSRVIFYGEADHVEGLLSAMDVFIFPSRWEGLGIAAVEAQISGLPCLLSDVVPGEADLGGDVQWISIEDKPAVWAEHIHTVSEETRENFITDHADTVARYQIDNTIRILSNTYSQLLKNRR